MKILLLGVGMQGKAALDDLVRSEVVETILAADQDLDMLKAYVASQNYGDKVRCESLDAADMDNLGNLMAQDVNVVIDLLPIPFIPNVARAAVAHGVHLVNTNYLLPEMKELADEAESKGLTLLPEFGLDPGIDLVMLGEALRSFDEVEEIASYGSGIPELAFADNVLKYKVSWTLDGVLKAYLRPGREVRQGEVVEIEADKTFYPENLHEVEIEGLGKLEAFPNGDALAHAAHFGVDPSTLKRLGRYTMRWPGHSAIWRTLVDLRLLDDEPALVDGVAVDRKRYLASVLEPQLQYGPEERDLAILLIEVVGYKDGQKQRAVFQMVDRRDLETGFSAMSRTVGFTASIGAQMIGSGELTQRGLLSPVTDIPLARLEEELRRRGVMMSYDVTEVE